MHIQPHSTTEIRSVNHAWNWRPKYNFWIREKFKKVRIKREYIGLTRCLRAFKLGLYNIGLKTRNFFTFDLKTRRVRSRHLTLFRKEIKHSTYPTLISKEPFSQFGILPITFSFLISRTALRPKGTRILKVQVRLLSSVKPERWTVPFGALYSDGGHLAKEVPSKLKTNISEGRKKFVSIAVFISRKLRIVTMKRITSPSNIFLDCWDGWGTEGSGGAIHMRMRLKFVRRFRHLNKGVSF